jgi:hypothetical protein
MSPPRELLCTVKTPARLFLIPVSSRSGGGSVRKRSIDRKTFLRYAAGLLSLGVLDRATAARLMCHTDGLDHPEPREGITAERVLTVEALGDSAKKKVVESYEAARTYPAIFDGIACACSCGGKKGTHRSLLVCFETMQPTGCFACQQEAELVGRLARENKSLSEIRAAVDKEFG